MAKWNSICQKEFQLAYYGHFNYTEIDSMTVHERETVYGMLVQQKTEEKEAYEKAVQNAKNKNK